MSLSNPNKPVTEERLQEFYHKIVPYMGGAGGGGSYTAGDGIDITDDVISTKQSEEGDIDEIIDVYPTAGNLVSIVNAFNKGDIYSTDEKMIGQWINGKPLYQKTIDCGAIPNTSTKSVNHNIANIESIVFINGIAIGTGQSLPLPLIYRNTSANDVYLYDVQIYVTPTKAEIVTKKDTWSSCNAYITIQYTKTTDTAISIGEATEYSTDEKVIGTWIDGKPIWQKTVIIDSITGVVDNTFSTFTANIASLNVDSVIYINGILKTASGSWQEINYRTTNAGLQIKLQVGITDTSKLIQLVTNTSSVNNGIAYVTMQYTKTTT